MYYSELYVRTLRTAYIHVYPPRAPGIYTYPYYSSVVSLKRPPRPTDSLGWQLSTRRRHPLRGPLPGPSFASARPPLPTPIATIPHPTEMLRTALAAAAVAAVAAPPPDLGLKNVLLIVIDDLRPQLGAYGLEEMHTPHIDRLASEGVLFTRAYAQQAICGPTRNSFMSGRYPEKTLTWNFIEWV